MKKYLFFILAVFSCFAFVSCEGEESPFKSFTQKDLLRGRWECTSSLLRDMGTASDTEVGRYIEFHEDGTYDSDFTARFQFGSGTYTCTEMKSDYAGTKCKVTLKPSSSSVSYHQLTFDQYDNGHALVDGYTKLSNTNRQPSFTLGVKLVKKR